MIRGRITTTCKFDRPYERLGSSMVPGRVQTTVEGELGEPDCAVQFEIRDGRPDCVEFIVKAKPDGRGVRSSDLSMLNLDGIAERAFTDFAYALDGSQKIGGSGPRAVVGDAERDRAARESEGGDQERWQLRGDIGEAITAPGRGTSEAQLKEVARIYREFPGAPTDAVGKMLGMSKRTASRRVKQAREAGLL